MKMMKQRVVENLNHRALSGLISIALIASSSAFPGWSNLNRKIENRAATDTVYGAVLAKTVTPHNQGEFFLWIQLYSLVEIAEGNLC